MYPAIAFTLALVCLVCAERADWPEPFVQSHRGAGNLAPENTLESFELAWKLGCVPEADVRAAADGVVVAFHDNTIERLAPSAPSEIRARSVNELPWSVVSKLDVGEYMGEKFKGQRVARISDVLDRMKGQPLRWLYMDVKLVPLEELARLVRDRGLERQVILASTRYPELRLWKKLLPKSQTLLWMGEKEPRLRERMVELQGERFADLTQLQIHVRVGDLLSEEPFAPSSEFLRAVGREIRPLGLLFQVLVIGSDNPDAYRKLMKLGVESFATDDPLVTLKVMREAGSKK